MKGIKALDRRVDPVCLDGEQGGDDGTLRRGSESGSAEAFDVTALPRLLRVERPGLVLERQLTRQLAAPCRCLLLPARLGGAEVCLLLCSLGFSCPDTCRGGLVIGARSLLEGEDAGDGGDNCDYGGNTDEYPQATVAADLLVEVLAFRCLLGLALRNAGVEELALDRVDLVVVIGSPRGGAVEPGSAVQLAGITTGGARFSPLSPSGGL